LAVALNAFSIDIASDHLLDLLAGDSRSQQWAAVVARRLGRPEDIGVLAGLTEARDPGVRAGAAASLARLAAAGNDSALVMGRLQRSILDTGTRVPVAIAEALANVPERYRGTDELLTVLRDHVSTKVRTAVAKISL
jgi:hypothetical protein